MTKLQQFQKERQWLFYRLKGLLHFDKSLVSGEEFGKLKTIEQIIDSLVASQKQNYEELIKQKGLKRKKE